MGCLPSSFAESSNGNDGADGSPVAASGAGAPRRTRTSGRWPATALDSTQAIPYGAPLPEQRVRSSGRVKAQGAAYGAPLFDPSAALASGGVVAAAPGAGHVYGTRLGDTATESRAQSAASASGVQLDLHKAERRAEAVPVEEDDPRAVALRELIDRQLAARWAALRAAYAKGAWLHLRVFLSSTFRDFAAERDKLTRVVFPALNDSLRARRISLVPVDLRWGLTEESTTSGPGALHLCLEEVERCRPYVLALIGARRGWAPDAYHFDESSAPQLAWLRQWPAGHAVTALELLYGVLGSRSPQRRPLVFLRDMRGTGLPPVFLAESPAAEEAVARLRARLEAAPGCRCVRYTLEAAPGARAGEEPVFTGLDEFAAAALAALRESIEGDFPLREAGPGATASLDDSAAQELFMEEACEAATAGEGGGGVGAGAALPPLAGRELTLEALRRHVADRGEENVLLLSAEPGMGKTTALAFLAREARAGPLAVFAHFCGASAAAASPPLLLRRAVRELSVAAGKEVPAEGATDLGALSAALQGAAAAAAEARGGVLLLVDDVGALAAGGESAAPPLDWLTAMPPAVRVILSAVAPREGRSGREELVDRAIRVRFRGRLRVEPLAGLDGPAQAALVRSALKRFGKELSAQQLAALLARPHGGRPLWLATACTELRLYGSFEGLAARVAALPGELEALMESTVLARLERDFEAGAAPSGLQDAARDLFCLLACSRGGLPEDDLIALLGTNRAGWARLMWSAGHYVRLGSGSAAEAPRLLLFHGSFAAAVRRRYALPAPTSAAGIAPNSLAAGFHARLADHFLAQADPSGDGSFARRPVPSRALADGPWHALAAGGERAARARAALAAFPFLCAAAAATPPLFDAAADLVAAALAGASSNKRPALAAVGAFLRRYGTALADDPRHLPQLALNARGAPFPAAAVLAGCPRAVLERVAGPPLSFAAELPEPVHALVGSEMPICAFALSPDGRLLASAAKYSKKAEPGQRALEPIRLWDAPNNRLLGLLDGHAQPPPGHKPRFHSDLDFGAVGISFSPDSKRLASLSGDKTVIFWDLELRIPAATARVGCAPKSSFEACMPWLPDSSALVLASEDETPGVDVTFVVALDPSTGGEKWRLPIHHPGYFDIARRDSDGALLFAYSDGDGISFLVYLEETPEGGVRETRRVELKLAGWVSRVRFARGGRDVVCASRYGTLSVFSTETGGMTAVLRNDGTSRSIYGIGIGEGGNRIATCHERWKGILVWDVDPATEEWRRGPTAHFIGCHGNPYISPDGLLYAADGLQIKCFDTKAADAIRSAKPLRWLEEAAEAGPPDPLRWFAGPRAPVKAVAASPDGCLLAAATGTEALWLWDAATGAERWHALADAGQQAPAAALAFSPDSRRLALLLLDGACVVWDVEKRTLLCVARAPGASSALQWDPSGDAVVALGSEGGAQFAVALDAATGAERWRLPLQQPAHFAVGRRAADGALLLAYSDENEQAFALTLEADGREAKRVELESVPVRCLLAFVRGGEQLICAGGVNSSLCVSNVEDGKRIVLLHRDGPPNRVERLVASPDGTAFLSTHSRWGAAVLFEFDGALKEWRKGPTALFARGCGPTALVGNRVYLAQGPRVLAFDAGDSRAAAAAGPFRLEDGLDPESVYRHAYVASESCASAGRTHLVANFAQSVVHVAELATGRSHRIVHDTPDPSAWGFVDSVSCTDDGALAALGDGHEVKVLEAATGAVVWQAKIDDYGEDTKDGGARVHELRYGPGGAREANLAVACQSVLVVKPGGGLLGSKKFDNVHFCTNVAWAADGATLYVAATHHDKPLMSTHFHVVRVSRSGIEALATVQVEQADLSSCIAVHGQLVALGCMDGLVRLFQGPKWRLLGTASGRKGREVDKGWLTGNTEGLHGLAFSPAGDYLALAGGSRTGALVFRVDPTAAGGPLQEAAWSPGEEELTGVWFAREEHEGRAAAAGRPVPGWTLMCSDRLGQFLSYRLHLPAAAP